jgi:pyridoxine 5-phosphate synthase
VARLQSAGIRVSLFIEPLENHVEAAKRLGADIIELHTGAFANAQGAAKEEHLTRLKVAALHARDIGLQVNAGHGINYENIRMLRTVPFLTELNIGHAIISRALFTGLAEAVTEMLAAMNTPAAARR